MAEDSFQEKTEDASPKRLSEAREQGNVPKSAEFNSVFILFFGLMTLSFLGTNFFYKLNHGFNVFYQEIGSMSVTLDSIHYYVILGLKSVLSLVAPLVAVIAIIGLGVNIAQVGFLFTTKPLIPNFKKLNPLSGFKKFVSLKSFVELIKGILKLLIVGLIAYYTLMAHKDRYLLLVNEEVAEIIKFIGTVMFQVALRTTSALLVLAILDLIYQRWQYKKDLKMTKQQVKEEQKQAEGDPLVKSAIRSMQQTRARERMMDKVPQADVVITNPTELAVALKYDSEAMDAPIVLAKGARLIARRMKEIAKENNIPIYENKPLARSLFKLCDVGKQIPVELFQAVAEVFAYVYQLKHRNN